MAQIIDYLRPGDIMTHAFHDFEHNILDDREKIRTELLEARSKGIIMDIGAHRAHFGVELSRTAIAQGFLPDTISSDIGRGIGYGHTLGPRARPSDTVSDDADGPRPGTALYNLPDVMTLFMGLGICPWSRFSRRLPPEQLK